MERIAIVGCSGGGKSTLARALGAKLGLPVVHMDILFWKPGRIDPDRADFQRAVDAAVGAERWITDGIGVNASALCFARADTIIWIELPMLICLWRALWRAVTGFGRERPDLAP